MFFNGYSIQPLVISLLHLVIGFFIFAKNRRSLVNRTFALECISVSVWLIGYFIAYSSSQYEKALFWCKFAYVGVMFVPVFFYHFTSAFLSLKHPKTIRLNYIVAIVLIILLFTTDKMIGGLYKFYWGYQAKIGSFHYLFLLYFTSLYLYCLFILYFSFRRKKFLITPLEYNKKKYVFIAYIIAAIGTIDFLPNYGIEFYPFGSIFVAAGFMTMNYAIIRYRLMDTNIVLTRAGAFVIVYALVLGVPFWARGFFERRMSGVTEHWWMFPMFLLAIFASAGPFIYLKIQRKIERRTRAQEFKSHEALRRLSHNMLRFTKLNTLLRLIVHALIKVLKLKFAGIYLFNEERNKYNLRSFWQIKDKTELPTEFSEDSALLKRLHEKKLPIVTEETRLSVDKDFSWKQKKELVNLLMDLRVNTVIPSFLRGKLLGVLVLSDRREKMAFSQEDLNLLMVLSNEAALSIENAQFHHREKMLLVEKSKREALADMAPGASHQFNNRLATISTTAELLGMKLGKINNDKIQDEDIKKILEDAKNRLGLIEKEAYRGKEITSAILNRAKAKVDLQEVSIVNLIDNAYKLVVIGHSKTGLEQLQEPRFKIVAAKDIPKMLLREALMQDSFYNIFDNGFYAIIDIARRIEKGEIRLPEGLSSYEGEIEVRIRRENNHIVIDIRDNGIGMTKENKKKLFTPYFTTKATSDKGTGLGLYVIREFIEMHGGTIACSSEYGKGTTFTIKLPIKRNNNHNHIMVKHV